MTDREEASLLLDEVQDIEARVRQALIYAHVSDFLFLWGAIWAVGFTANYFLRDQSNLLWDGLEAIGLAATVAIVWFHRRRSDAKGSAVLWRAGLSVAAIVAFGTLWTSLVDMNWRLQVTFWPTLLAFILFLISLWIGRTLALAALGIFAVSLTGYFVAGPYLHLWMAVATGGAMIAGGLWLRR